MSDRRSQIVRLLETRDDHLPQPSRRDHAPSGFVHHTTHRISCPDCLANDRTMFGCETCGGRGYVEEDRARDPYAEHEKVQPYGLDGTRHDHTLAIDRAISIAENELRRFPGFRPASNADEITDANAHPEAWETARRRMYQLFDYRQLDQALELLRAADEAGYRLLHSVYVYRWLTDVSTAVEAVCERGLSFLDRWMPDPIRSPDAEPAKRLGDLQVPRAAPASARELRDQKILELAAEGKTPLQISVACNLSVRTVYSIVQAAA